MQWTLAIFWAQVAWGGCDEPVSARELGDAAVRAEQAWADMDSERFVVQAERLGSQLPCVSDALFPEQVAAWFRVQGMLHFYEGDEDLALSDFRAALAGNREWQLGTDLAGPGHPLRALVEQARLSGTFWDELERPAEGWIRIDGEQAMEIPVDRPYLFQRFDAEGRVVETCRIRAGNGPPAYEVRGSAVDTLDAPEFTRYRLHQRNGRIVTGLGLVGLIGGAPFALYGLSPGAQTYHYVGVGMMVAGGGAMVAGVPMQLVPAIRERKELLRLGADPGLTQATVSWALYAVGVPTVLYVGVGLIPYIGAIIAAGEQSRVNRNAERQLRHGVIARRRPRVAVAPMVRERGAGLQLAVTRW